ncbi:M23 family metallopeptidase [Geomonas oryzisoli]|uniref:M23 family metallopeptidase n=1 Tax=Geomonas oryzisoli TaxID=2847992 RepID=A0ABX8JBZ6_9BACT|nr:M23 family metallopeptidase [Geomonas oryzisoli]QWV94209.1 M23 family metallopeptidase [Geomonas oryzisoli]
MKRTWRRLILAGLVAVLVLFLGFVPSDRLAMPVKGASSADWNPKSFWCSPWGKSGVHRGIDIFAQEGTPVMAASPGIVVYAGYDTIGGNVVSILGPKWRIHYYAHLKEIAVKNGDFLHRGVEVGTVGCTGNAAGKPPHLHYAIVTQIPHVRQWRGGKYGFDRMFYLDPGAELTKHAMGGDTSKWKD